jgi:peroxiredoxin
MCLTISAQNDKAPDFSVEALDGKTYSLEDFKGKNLLLLFWSTSCPICQKDLPKLNESLKNRPENLQVIAITAENETRVSKFLKQKPLDFIIGFNGLGVMLNYARKNSKGEFFLSYPFYVLINQQGNIVQKAEGEGNVEKILSAIEQLTRSESKDCSLR